MTSPAAHRRTLSGERQDGDESRDQGGVRGGDRAGDRARHVPAASSVLTDPDEYDLSNTQYGTLFVPQVVTAITAALLGASLSGRLGTK